MATNYQAPSRHASQKHQDAGRVTTRLNKGGDVFSKVGPDNRRYTFKDRGDGKAFDVSIDDPASGANITRFCCTSLNWIARKLLWLSILALLVYYIIMCAG